MCSFELDGTIITLKQEIIYEDNKSFPRLLGRTEE